MDNFIISKETLPSTYSSNQTEANKKQQQSFYIFLLLWEQ